MKKSKIAFIAIAVCILIILVVPYLRVEILTWHYGSEFSTLYKASNMLDDIEYFKVMDYTSTSARIYYVANNREGADLFRFVKKDEQWVLDRWETIWSKSGSADDFIWPYFYHSTEGLLLFIFIGILTFLIIAFIYFIVAFIKKRKTYHIT